MHVSGSSIMDKCIIHMFIMATCIRINNVCIIHTNVRVKDHTFMHATGSRIMDMCMDICIIHCKSYTHASGSRIEDHRYVHHTHMQYSQGPRNIDMCIIYTCIRVKDRGTLINASYTYVSGSWINHGHMYQGQESYIHACFRIKVQDHR